jgi:hypothetical protein
MNAFYLDFRVSVRTLSDFNATNSGGAIIFNRTAHLRDA